LGSYVGYALLELSPFLSLSSVFLFLSLIVESEPFFFQWPEKKREEKRCQKIQDRAPE
jgi:hypothetical protein